MPVVVSSSITGTGPTHHLLRVCRDLQEQVLLIRTDTPECYVNVESLGTADAVDMDGMTALLNEQQQLLLQAKHALFCGASAPVVNAAIWEKSNRYVREIGLGISPGMAIFTDKSMLVCPSSIISAFIDAAQLKDVKRIRTTESPATEIAFMATAAIEFGGRIKQSANDEDDEGTQYNIHGYILFRDGESTAALEDMTFLSSRDFFYFSRIICRGIRQVLKVPMDNRAVVDTGLIHAMRPVTTEFPSSHHDAAVLIITPMVQVLLHGSNHAQLFFTCTSADAIILRLETGTGIASVVVAGSPARHIIWSDTSIGKIDTVITKCTANICANVSADSLMQSDTIIPMIIT